MKTVQTGILWRIASTRMPTKWGMFSAIGFERQVSDGQVSNGQVSNGSQRAETALAIVLGDMTGGAPLLRIHSQCFTGEVLGSLRCDCNDQLEMAMQAIAAEGRGLVIYEYQEGRGIGLMAKLQAYELQDVGIDTVQANHALGVKADCRDFTIPGRLAPWLMPASRLSRGSPAKLRRPPTPCLTCGPSRKEWATHRVFDGTAAWIRQR